MDDDSTRVLPRKKRRARTTDPDGVADEAFAAEEREDEDDELDADDLVDAQEDEDEYEDGLEPMGSEDTIPDSGRSKRDRLGTTRRISRNKADKARASVRRKPRRYAYASMEPADDDLSSSPWRSDSATDEHDMPAFSRSDIDWRQIAGWAAGIGVLLVLLLVVILSVTGSGDISEEDLVGFYEQIEAGDFDAAEATLASLDPSEELAGRLRPMLEEGRKKAAVEHRKAAAKHFANKAYRDTVESARLAIAAVAAVAGPDTLFILAESLRILEEEEAGDIYARFVDEFPNDGRSDDALFWRAEWLVAHDRLDEAREAFEKVIAAPKGNFKTSAGRRLREID